MSKATTHSSAGGIGFGSLLAIVFITLKLCHVIDWSWWWVLSPVLIPLALIILFLLAVGIGAMIVLKPNK